MAALYRRAVSGEAVSLEIPMFEYMCAYVLKEHLGQRTYGSGDRSLGDPRLLDANTAPIQTRDGWISVTVNTDRQFRNFVAGAGREDLVEDPRFSTLGARIDNLGEWLKLRNGLFTEKTTEEWLSICRGNDIPAMPCSSLSDLLSDPQLMASGLLEEVEHPEFGGITLVRSPLRVDGAMADETGASSALGADTQAVLERTGE